MFKIIKTLSIILVLSISSYFLYNNFFNTSTKNKMSKTQNYIDSVSNNEDEKNDIENKIEKEDDNNTESIENASSQPVFSYSSIPYDVKTRMLGKSMPKNEPISFDSLSYLKISYYGFDNKDHIGEMIVSSKVASDVVDIFKELYEKKYPIEKINLIDEYNAIDETSMADNNSSAFCYRTIANTNVISNHGKGLAIDINTLQNPHVIGNSTNPKEGYSYANRSNVRKGMIQQGDDCYNAFVKRGWVWGGHWSNPDYQHFEYK